MKLKFTTWVTGKVMVMDAKLVILDMIAAAFLPAVKAASALDDILKPSVVAA